MTPKAYAAAHRARRIRDELSRADTVTEAIYGAGFNSSSRFYAKASEVLGMTPCCFLRVNSDSELCAQSGSFLFPKLTACTATGTALHFQKLRETWRRLPSKGAGGELREETKRERRT